MLEKQSAIEHAADPHLPWPRSLRRHLGSDYLQSSYLIATALLTMRGIPFSTAAAVMLVLSAACAAAASTDDGGAATQGSGGLQEQTASTRLKVRC